MAETISPFGLLRLLAALRCLGVGRLRLVTAPCRQPQALRSHL